MRIVVLTNKGSIFGKKILNAFIADNIKIEAVVVIQQPAAYYWKLFSSVCKRVGLIDAIRFSIRRLAIQGIKKEPDAWNGARFLKKYEDMGVKLFYSKATNSMQTRSILNSISPDVLVLGQTGIVCKDILNIPKKGSLNVHPGILPYYRGIDCALWAIYDGEFDKIGNSVHWVDEGVDTGNIIVQKKYSFLGNESIETIEDKLYDQGVIMMRDAVSEMTKDNITVGEAQDRGIGKKCFKMPYRSETAAKKRLREFLKQ